MAKIIVVDDDPLVGQSMVRFLGRLGHDVDHALDGMAALRAIRHEPPDLVITDINMPEMDGIEVITHIREISPELPIIAMSGGGLLHKELLLDNAGALGAISTLQKPFELEEIRALLDEVLGEAG